MCHRVGGERRGLAGSGLNQSGERVDDGGALLGGDVAQQLGEPGGAGYCQFAGGAAAVRGQFQPHEPGVAVVFGTSYPTAACQLGDQSADGALLQAQPSREFVLREGPVTVEFAERVCFRGGHRCPAGGAVRLVQSEGAHERGDPALQQQSLFEVVVPHRSTVQLYGSTIQPTPP
jgi:hypothetical protein